MSARRDRRVLRCCVFPRTKSFCSLTFVAFSFRRDTVIGAGDIFHVIDLSRRTFLETEDSVSKILPTMGAEFPCWSSSSGRAVLHCIDEEGGLLVVHPEVTVSPTKIADSCTCVRRGVLTERVRGLQSGSGSLAAIMGNLRHAFIEVGNYIDACAPVVWDERRLIIRIHLIFPGGGGA